MTVRFKGIPPLEKHRTYARPSRMQGSTPDIPRPSYVLREKDLENRTFGVVIDTSGSMCSAQIGLALGAIASYAVSKDVPFVRIVFCDAKATDAGYMAPEDIAGRVEITGRGGTILQPGIDALEKAKDFPPTGPILVITDGYVEDKNMILDVRVLLNNQEIINLEMQVINLYNWPERSLSYLCRMFDQLKTGEDYVIVKKTIHISITDFTPNGFPEILYSDYFLYNLKTLHKYSDKFGIYMLQLNQLGNPEDEKNMPDIYYWAQLFKAKTWEEIQMLAEKNQTIQQSIATLQELTADEKMRMQMEARERYRRDYEAAIEFGRHESDQERQQMKEQLSLQEKQLSQKDKELAQRDEKLSQKDKELAQKDELIRSLQEQIAQANK